MNWEEGCGRIGGASKNPIIGIRLDNLSQKKY